MSAPMTTRADALISVVLPVFNEGGHLAASLRTIERTITEAGHRCELVLVDDGSSDTTWEIVREAATRPGVRGLRFSRNFGKEAALMAGLEAARGDAVLVMDADLQHPPALIPRMIFHWREEGFEVVEGVKRERGRESPVYTAVSRAFYRGFHALSGFDLRGASDFKLLDRAVVDALLRLGENQTFFRGLAEWVGFRRKRLAFAVAPRAGGQSGWTLRALARLALTATTSFSSVPLLLILYLGMGFLALAFVLTMIALVRYAIGESVTGFTTVIILQCIIGSLMMISNGVLGIYLSHVFSEVKRRPRYLVRETAGVDGV